MTMMTMHYAKVVKTGFEVVNFDKLILHQFSTKMSQIFNDGVKTSKILKRDYFVKYLDVHTSSFKIWLSFVEN